MSTCYIKKVGNSFYIRYANDTSWVYCPGATISECATCCPHSTLTLWEDPNLVCSDARITHVSDLLSPYFNITQEATPPTNAFSILCGTPPQANVSSRIEIKIPYDPIFSGTYIFDYKPTTDSWKLNDILTKTSLSVYNDATSPRYNTKIISLAETHSQPTYKGYTEIARSGDTNSNLSGVFAFPSRFVFSAIQPPSDADTQTPFPTGTGYRAVLGFQLPIRWRGAYNDWVVVDAGGHRVSGSKYAKGWEGWETPNWIPSVSLSVSGYATSMSGSGTIGLSGITNIPASYNLGDTTTAITGACTGLAHMGFCYKTSASGLPFDNATYGTDMQNFTGIRQQFHKKTITYNSTNYTLDETRLFRNKTDMEAWITFSFSCRTSGTICNDFDYISPVSTGYTTISGSCVGSYINADFVCGDNIARPSGAYFTTENITDIKVVYSGLSDNVYPFVKIPNTSSGNIYKAGLGQMIYIDYTDPATPDDFRKWISSNFNFVEVDGSNNITRKWPGVDVYWSKPVSPANTIWARLIPCDSAAFESTLAGVVIFNINNVNVWEAAGQPGSEFLGQYEYDSVNNRFLNANDNTLQMRFIVNKWHLGKVNNDNLTTYYVLEFTTGGIPTLLNPNFVDYSNYTPPGLTWNNVKIPVLCSTVPVGEWSSTSYAGTGVAITVKDPIPLGAC